MKRNRIILAALLLAAGAAVQAAEIARHELHVSVDPAGRVVRGEALLEVPRPGSEVELRLGTPYRVDAVALLRERGGERRLVAQPGPVAEGRKSWRVRLGRRAEGPLRLRVAWSGQPPALPEDVRFNRDEVVNLPEGYLAAEGMFLSPESGWYPTGSQQLSQFRLEALVPAGWRVLSEGRRVEPVLGAAPAEAGGGRVREVYVSENPLPGIDIVAAGWKVSEREFRAQRVAVYALADTPDDLVRNYLEATERYLLRFSREIGPHPWPQFVVAEHILPTGLGMPSFTLLGSAVMRLPFIIRTSLGHEVLHDWWGNGVYVDERGGNWCEGLTAYLADHDFAGEETAGGDVEYRRQILRDYAEYLLAPGTGAEQPVSAFRERHDRATRALGYGKVAMIFHMLRRKLGDDAFRMGLTEFFSSYRYRHAAWSDIAAVFARTAPNRGVEAFFRQWVERPGAPELRLDDVQLQPESVAVSVATGDWALDVPAQLEGAAGARARGSAPSVDGVARITIAAIAEPSRVVVDPDADLFRKLDPSERPATLARMFAAPPDLLLIGTGRGPRFTEAARAATAALAPEVVPRFDREVAAPEFAAARRVWLVGRPGPEFLRLAGAQLPEGLAFDDDAITVAGRESTAADAAGVVVVETSDDGANTLGIIDALQPGDLVGTARRATHYGKYSWLLFEGGQAVVKQTAEPRHSPLVRDLRRPAR
ncbi:MAG: hypothetical protein KBD01_14145 [Acidobacteria bacterium]|nr:hypothetical protein [Acidobacteriota bacterium]